MTWPLQKFDLVNEALLACSDNVVVTANDGSDEWNAGSNAYEMAIEYMYDNHNWTAITKIAEIHPLTTPPMDNQFDTAYAKPPDCVHLIWVRLNDMPVYYKITNNNIEVSAVGGSSIVNPAPPGTLPGVITAKWVSSDQAGDQSEPAQKMTRTFFAALRIFTMSGIYRTLHEDPAEARLLWKEGAVILQEARTRADQEMGKRAFFNHRISAARRIRRPWPVMPPGWGGTGQPG